MDPLDNKQCPHLRSLFSGPNFHGSKSQMRLNKKDKLWLVWRLRNTKCNFYLSGSLPTTCTTSG